MKQCNWTYVDDRSKVYKVQLLHSPRHGHLLLLVNSKITLIDFKILQNYSYPLYLGDELCVIKIERKDDRFVYTFDIDKKVDSPRNQRRRKQERSDLRKTLFTISGFILFIVVFAGVFSTCQREGKEDKLAQAIAAGSQQTIATIVDDPNDRRVFYYYNVGGRAYRKAYLAPKGESVDAMGLPVQSGDEFMVEYAITDPALSKLQLTKPTDKQYERYAGILVTGLGEQFPKSTDRQRYCVLVELFDADGLAAWGEVYKELSGSEPSTSIGYWKNKPHIKRAFRKCEIE